MRFAHHTHENAELIRTVSLPAKIWTRLRATSFSLVIVAAIAALSHALWGLPYWLGRIRQDGVVHWLYAIVLPDLVTAFIMLMAIRGSTDNGTDLARRPGRFLLALLLGVTLAEVVMVALYELFNVPKFTLATRPPESYLIAWLNSMLFGGLFGWLGILHLQRIEDRERFSAAMARRSLLARQVTQSRLAAVRARTDPEWVANVLRNVLARYRKNGEDASSLLDQLIGHLRLAMTRARERLPSPAAEMALIRSYLALREVESGISIALHGDLVGQEPARPDLPIPIFPAVRRLCDEAVLAAAEQVSARIDMRIESMPSCLCIELKLVAAAIAPWRLAQTKAYMAELSLGHDDTLQHFADSEGNRYVVQVAIR